MVPTTESLLAALVAMGVVLVILLVQAMTNRFPFHRHPGR